MINYFSANNIRSDFGPLYLTKDMTFPWNSFSTAPQNKPTVDPFENSIGQEYEELAEMEFSI